MTSPDEDPERPAAALPGENGVAEDSSATLGRVRELLFGETSRVQEARTTAVRDEMSARLDELRAEFEERLQDEVRGLRDEVRAEIARIDDRLAGHADAKVERTDLRRLLTDLADRIGGDGPA